MSRSAGVTRTFNGITFAVDDVDVAIELAPEFRAFDAATQLIGEKLGRQRFSV